MQRHDLLIIDDEENMRHMLESLLSRSGYRIDSAASGPMALQLIEAKSYDFILCDIKMPEMDGLEFLRRGRAALEQSTVIMMSAYGSVDRALEAMQEGAYDFISKPFKTDEVLLALKKAAEREQLRSENVQLKQQLSEIKQAKGFTGMVAVSGVMTELIRLARRVGKYDTSVLITGESGTGKELIARGVHQSSARAAKPFVAVNCGSIPEALLESELFGYRKGAFTGAQQNRPGLFREADTATLFLDEIGELPLQMQVKLLRVLQERELRPLGGTKTVAVDVRLIAATSRDLTAMVADGGFREDLYYRLNVMPLKVPPLRQRIEDIPALVAHFINKFNNHFGTRVSGVSGSALERLVRYSWPGNVRELENAIQRGLVLSEQGQITAEDLPDHLRSAAQRPTVADLTIDISRSGFSLKAARQQLESQMIGRALQGCHGNKSKTAALLGISYPSLLAKIKQYQLGS